MSDRLEALRRIVLADLERGVRLTLAVQDDIDPQFRFATPEGDVALAVTFPFGIGARQALFDKLRAFCAWKQVLAYTMTFGLVEPNALMTVGVSRDGVVGCMVTVKGEPGAFSDASFGKPVWVARESIDDMFAMLLPGKVAALSDADLADLRMWFGREGRFPAVHLPSGSAGL